MDGWMISALLNSTQLGSFCSSWHVVLFQYVLCSGTKRAEPVLNVMLTDCRPLIGESVVTEESLTWCLTQESEAAIFKKRLASWPSSKYTTLHGLHSNPLTEKLKLLLKSTISILIWIQHSMLLIKNAVSLYTWCTAVMILSSLSL